MVGIKPVTDALGRVNKLEVTPLEELGRPRVDVVVNCSGVFRDLFVNQVGTLCTFAVCQTRLSFVLVVRHISGLASASSLAVSAMAWIGRSCLAANKVALQRPNLLPATSVPAFAVFRPLLNDMGLCLQMNLLDRAIKLAAEQDEPEEMNFVRKHARQQVGQCACDLMS